MVSQDARILLIVLPAYIVFLVAVGWVLLRPLRYRIVLERLFRALQQNLAENDDTDSAAQAISIVYGRLTQHYPNVAHDLRSPADAIEEFIYRYDTRTDREFRQQLGIERVPIVRERVTRLLAKFRAENPFANLSSQAAALFRNVQEAIATGSADHARASLVLLADEVERVEGVVRTQERRNTIATLISVVGVILTLVFGAVSVIQLLR